MKRPIPINLLDFLTVLGLMAISAASHWVLVPVGLAIHNGEWSTFLLVADAFREGYRSAFPFQNDYGGLTLTALRAVFTSLYDGMFLGPFDHARGHMIFSYAVSPALLTAAAYACLRSYYTYRIALGAGFLAALGLGGWTYNFGNEFYPLMLICGFLAFAAKGIEPHWWRLPRFRILILGFFLGHGHYATRTSQLFVVALLVPWHQFFDETIRLWQRLTHPSYAELRKQKKIAYILALIGVFFLCLGLYLEIFGRDFGAVEMGSSSRMIKMDGEPNFLIGSILVVLARALFGAYHPSTIFSNKWGLTKPFALLFLGLTLGSLPEHIHWFTQGRLTSTRQFASYDFDQMATILGQLPRAFREVLTGYKPSRDVVGFQDNGLGQNAVILLAIISLLTLLFRLKKERTYDSVIALAALSTFSFLRVNPQFGEIAPARYLLPLTIAITIGWGTAIEWGFTSTRLRKICTGLLITAACWHQVGWKTRLANHIQSDGIIAHYKTLVDKARQHDVNVVISDDFWMANNLEVLSHGSPRFWATWHDWGPPKSKQLALNESRAMIMLKKNDSQRLDQPEKIELMGYSWTLSPVGLVASKRDFRFLFIGTRIDP
jgi:hypothetical protein